MANVKKSIQKNIKRNNELKKKENPNKTKILFASKILFAILLTLILVYFITLVANGDYKFNDNNSNSTDEQQIILAGQTFDKKYDTYYVVFYDFKNDSNLTSKIEEISTKKIFRVNIADKINSSVISDNSNNKASNSNELRINGITLIKIENGKNMDYIEGISEVTSYLSNLK